MYVSRLEVENLRGFRGVRNVDLDLTRPDGSHAGWTVLAGPNGAGKTTLLAALAAALGEETDPAGWLAPGEDEGGIRLDGAHWRVSRTEDGITARRNGVLGFWAGYPARRELTEGIGWLAGQQLQALERQPGAVELVAGVRALLDDGLLPSGYRIGRIDSDGLQVDCGGTEHPLGGGLAAAVGLVLDLLARIHQAHPEQELVIDGTPPTVPVPGVVLIDEVEAHLHLDWQQRLGEWLVGHFPGLQFIVSTHSPYVCQSADPGGLVRLPGPGEESAPYVLDEDLHQRIVYGSGDDTALTELFGLPSVYSPQAEAERRLLIALERKLYAGHASSAEVAEYRELGARLNASLAARVDEARDRLGGAR
ncbi:MULTISPECIES: AAA family ATPase [unclassified Kitasatospora]|uniref:AAA family ATPase n=1 Tax=unclassified Kitasatospora TaxID=2633591 RepID=UPI00070F2920|nr:MULTISPECIES: AAA family ATPase [unclassified Kitasatospora]KQV23920.1 hypothetical protein ASC99_01535 [Kitasatospora sp. Root107]KRB67368.1 hypothetical protein ASE03_03200 [Kitasatospora sp. Root187]